MLKGGTRFSVNFVDVFAHGCKYLPDSIGEVEEHDEKTGRRTPAKDKLTGQRVYQVRVYDMDVELGKRSREVAVKILADVQPVPVKIVSQISPERGRERVSRSGRAPGKLPLTCGYGGGRYWDRTSGLFGVNE